MRFLRVSAGSVGSSLGPIRNALCIYRLYSIDCLKIKCLTFTDLPACRRFPPRQPRKVKNSVSLVSASCEVFRRLMYFPALAEKRKCKSDNDHCSVLFLFFRRARTRDAKRAAENVWPWRNGLASITGGGCGRAAAAGKQREGRPV